MNIRVKLTRKNNQVVAMDLEKYVFGVVASEVGNAPLEACKAQAVAARTTAFPYANSDSIISDSHPQAFNIDRVNEKTYPIAFAASQETKDELLYFNGKLCDPCSYSASNGGRTTSSESRWGGYRAYLIEQPDPWDLKATNGKKTGHGVGMSQRGAMQMAKEGLSYEQILSFYYPNTVLRKEAIAVANVKASYLVEKFKLMADQKWKYVAGAARKGEVDCSGAFSYWYDQADSYMYHGSNTMWRKYTIKRGKIGDIELVPGMPVFKHRNDDKEPEQYHSDGLGNFYHVGLYIGEGKVVEAKGTKSGVVYSSISSWTHAARLKNTEYDLCEGHASNEEIGHEEDFPCFGTVSGVGEYLNLRKGPSRSQPRIEKAYNGDVLTIIGETDGWYIIERSDQKLYVDKSFVLVQMANDDDYTISISVDSETEKQQLINLLTKNGFAYTIAKGGDD